MRNNINHPHYPCVNIGITCFEAFLYCMQLNNKGNSISLDQFVPSLLLSLGATEMLRRNIDLLNYKANPLNVAIMTSLSLIFGYQVTLKCTLNTGVLNVITLLLSSMYSFNCMRDNLNAREI
jgi:hypothetical protein